MNDSFIYIYIYIERERERERRFDRHKDRLERTYKSVHKTSSK